MKTKSFAAFILMAFFAAAGASAAGPIAPESGTMFGRVSDLDGNPLPGASVSLIGPAVMGQRSSVTSATGQFFFPLIDPGVYEVRVEMPGFKIQLQRGLAVQSGRTMVVVFKMEETAVDEEVAAPAGDQPLDTRSAKVSGVLDSDVLTRIPLPRDLFHVWALVPGAVADVATDRRFVSVEGSDPRSQIVMLEGAVLNDPRTGIPAAHPPDDVISEVEYVSDGQPAGIASSDGTYLQIVTKRAGNGFTGGLSYYTSGAALAQNLDTSSTGTFRSQPPDRYEKYRDLSFAFGGSVMEDRAWVFLAGRWMTETIANPYSPETRMAALGITDSPAFDLDRRELTGFARLSIRPTEDIKYTGLLLFNNFKEPYDIASVTPDASADRIPQRTPDNILVTTHNINFLLGPNTYADLHGTYIHRTYSLVSRAAQGTAAAYDAAQDVWWGTAPYEGTEASESFGGRGSVTHYKEDLFGLDHEIRIGAEYSQAETHND
ncbi:MAG: TonB-dependent receptor, partial [Candidatus Aminicenantales bacterium]